MDFRFTFPLVAFVLSTPTMAQTPPTIQWQKALGGSDDDRAYCIEQTTDGDYILVGLTSSNDGDVTGFHGGFDAWVVKMNGDGNVVWQKALGGSEGDEFRSINETSDGGFIAYGNTHSNDGDVSGYHGGADLWVVKLNGLGGVLWQKALGGSSVESGSGLQQTSDGGYVVSGSTYSNDGDVSGSHSSVANPNADAWVVKLNSTGGIQWQRALGGSGGESAALVQQTADGGFLVVTSTSSSNGDVADNHGGSDIWVIKLSSTGGIQWQQVLGGSDEESPNSFDQTIDGGYIIAGTTASSDGDVSGLHGGFDAWVIKVSSTGSIQWQRALGGSENELASSVLLQQTDDGGYIFLYGSMYSNDGDVSGNHGESDLWVVKLSSSGGIQWQRTLGGANNDHGHAIQLTTDGGYLISATTYSSDGDVIGNHGGLDLWVVRLNGSGGIQWQKTLGGSAFEFFPSLVPSSDDGYILSGQTNSNDGDVSGNHGPYPTPDAWVVKLSSEGVGMEEVKQSTYVIAPNPSLGFVCITTSILEYAALTLTDALGREVLRERMMSTKHTLDLSALPKGPYLLTLRSEQAIHSERLVLE